jgi:endoglucanase
LSPAFAALVCMALIWGLANVATAAAAPLSISVSGNHFVNGEGQTVRLVGVNHPSFEYACHYGYALNDGHFDDADAAAIASWNASAVRIPLNENCWLGLNGEPAGGLTVQAYRQAVQSYVAALNAHGLYAILDLHWTGPKSTKADGQRPMTDERSPEFWTSVAETFKGNPAVIFDLFNEPYSPAKVFGGGAPTLDWQCWRDGGCQLPVSNDTEQPSKTLYTATGMQSLIDAVRGTGATQPVLLGGLDYANDLTQWLAFMPKDPLGQIAASFHNYEKRPCDNVACWSTTIAGVAAQVPVVTGEFGEEICNPTGFDERYMSWADGAGIGYLAWGWWVLTAQEKAEAGCKGYFLLDDYNGTPAAPNGTAVHDHLVRLPPRGLTTGTPPGGGGSGSAIRLTKFKATFNGGKVKFQLRSAQNCTGKINGKAGKRLSLGKTNFSLVANKVKTVKLKLPKRAKRALANKGELKAAFTITLTSAGTKTVLKRNLTLKR